jgi:putative nucleotidyltransferase with HDIG domain
MPPSEPLTRFGRLYVSAVIAGGLCVVLLSVRHVLSVPVGSQYFLLVALTLISGSATVRLPSIPASISISETFVFSAVLLYGPAAGTLMVALDGLMASYWLAKRRREPYRAFFNMSAPAISVWCSANLFFWIASISPLVAQPATLNSILPSLALFAVAYFGLNSLFIAIAISAETRIAPLKVWRENFVWLSLNYFFGASVAVLLVVYTRQVDIQFIGVILPLLFVLYLTFKISMDRLEDAKQHVDKVNSMYLSTIETLAMAIDAKDQITHGHIRRVQRYAIGLANEIGVEDPSLLKAIETAALLHDMGKLAVPEHILNKPGRLTTAEFEKMKLHASVGADILSAIDFPYPVVPIVRHHHESWDGTGYPDGLRGVAIPIGARILSVVDCFDALTSDRPYRPRLSDQEAMRILNERKGTMYDPVIVETFERIHADLEAQSQGDRAIASSLYERASKAHERTATRLDAAVHTDNVFVFPPKMLDTFTQAVAGHVRRANPDSVCIFYVYDPQSDEIVASHTDSDTGRILGLRIALGQRLSGWVAANRCPIVGSDAALDLGDRATSVSPALTSCLSVPVNIGSDLLGVFSVYSPHATIAGSDHVLKEVSRAATEFLLEIHQGATA